MALPLPLLATALATTLLLLGAFWAGVVAARHRRLWAATLRLGVGLPLLLLLGVLGVLGAGQQGYRALTQEQLAATVETRPLGPGRFAARFSFPDGREQEFELAGDQLYIDAYIIKWHYFAQLLGLSTVYELDRVTGRYHDLEAERNGPRTVYPLTSAPTLDLPALKRRLPALVWLYDAEYGSATFVPVDTTATYEIRVSTTGLLARRRPAPTPPTG